MRVVVSTLLIAGCISTLTAQAPGPARPAAKPAATQLAATRSAASHPDATLAQIMRGLLFPNSNVLFDVQENDPATPKQPASSGSADYSNVYAGWQSVEGAAAAIEESVELILKPGRLCSNGKVAPVTRPDYVKFAQGLRAAGQKTLAAANAKNRDEAIERTNDLAEACDNCHQVYRDKGPAGGAARCTP